MQRWQRVGIIAGGLFLVNVIARLVVRLAAGDDDDKQVTIGIWALVAVGVVLVPVAFRYAQRWAMVRVWSDLAIAIGVACLLAVLVGPFVSGAVPFADGFGLVARQFVYFAGFSLAGVLLGVLAAVTLGLDHRSQALKRYVERVNTKPRRVVKR